MTKVDFIYADKLKNSYNVVGRFYDLETDLKIEKCRSLLTITDISCNNKNNQDELLVVMLNPGGSQPADENYIIRKLKKNEINRISEIPLVKTKPDIAQYQIMRLMNLKKIKKAKIINLWDVRNTKSKEIIDKVKNKSMDLDHITSIFCKEREGELKDCIHNNPIIILGWGNIKTQNDIAKKVKDKLSNNSGKIYCVTSDSNNFVYHPSPPSQKYKERWLNEIIKNLQNK